jgi:hypothetical protein
MKIGFAFVVTALALGLFAYGCDHGGDVPYSAPFCMGDVSPCPGYPTRNTLDGLHIVQAECADINASLNCQVDTIKTYAYAVCSSCSAPWSGWSSVRDAHALEQLGVHLCSPLAYKTGAWCATCDAALSMELAYTAPEQEDGGFASDVVCVSTCAACAVAP